MLGPETNLGPYRLISRLGAGGMGEVWKAEDTRLGRIVAIKVLAPSFAMDAEATARLKREARTAAQLYHPNIAMIHSIEQDGELIFIVMEYVEGQPLTSLMKSGPMAEAEICRIGRGVADALAEAHAHGIVHRDIKPDNIIVTASRVKVLDFGIAKQVGVQMAQPTSPNAPTAFMTQQGMILGTVHYMSPEQALGKELDGRTDIFSLGVVLYEMATGRLPFGGETITETMMHIIRDEPPDAATVNPNISPGLQSIIRRALRKSRDERFANAGELATALEQQLGKASTAPYTQQQTVKKPLATPPTVMTSPKMDAVQPPPKAKRGTVWLWVALAVILLAVGIFGAYITRSKTPPPAPVPAATKTDTTGTTATPPAVAPTSSAAVSVTSSQPQVEENTASADTTEGASPDEKGKSVEEPPPPPSEETNSSADDSYAQGVQQLQAGDWRESRKAFSAALRADPHYAKAHFRLGEIATINHNYGYAMTELEAARADNDRMDPRERHLTRLCIAICQRNLIEARRIGMEIERLWPGDPDVDAIRRSVEEGRQERQGRGRRFRP